MINYPRGWLSLVLSTAFIVAVWCSLNPHLDKHAYHEEVDKTKHVKVDQKHSGLSSDSHAKTYKTLFKVKHREQLIAVQHIMSMDNNKKQKKLLNELLATMEKVVKSARSTIEKLGYKPTNPFPEEQKLRDAVANVVENTAFFCEFVLRFPSVIEKLLRTSKEWNDLVKWGYEFSSSAKLYDESGEKLLHLAAQQLNLIPSSDGFRDENFYNPYDKKAQKEQIEREAVRKLEEAEAKKKLEKQIEKKKKKEHKPSLSKSEL